MADTAVPITAGSGTNIDVRTESTNGDVRQVVVLGDPSANTGVAPVSGTAGLKVDLGADNDVTVTGTVAVSSVPSHAVTNAGTFTVQIDGAVSTFAEDAAHVSGDRGITALALRRDTTPSSSSGTAGDYSTLNVDANGRLYVNAALYDAAGAAVTAAVDYTHDGALTTATTSGPITILRAVTALPAVVAADDAVLALGDLSGRTITSPYAPPAATWVYAGAAGGLVSTTGVTAKAAAGASIRNYIDAVQYINSHQTISTEIVITDGAAGTVLHRGWAQAAGGGGAYTFTPPLRGTANTLVEIKEITATATAGVIVNLQGHTGIE